MVRINILQKEEIKVRITSIYQKVLIGVMQQVNKYFMIRLSVIWESDHHQIILLLVMTLAKTLLKALEVVA